MFLFFAVVDELVTTELDVAPVLLSSGSTESLFAGTIVVDSVELEGSLLSSLSLEFSIAS